MTHSIAPIAADEISPASTENTISRAAPWQLIPGIALLFAIGYAGKYIEAVGTAFHKNGHPHYPNIEYVLWAILIGLIVGNTIGAAKLFRPIFNPGIATYEFWLKLGIVLLGVRFLLADVASLGGKVLGLVAIELAVAIVLMIVVGKLFGLTEKLTALLAVGSSICGVSAIIATQGAIKANNKDTSYAIAAILALGAISLFTYPLIAKSLHMSDRAYGIWAGLSVDNTAEATAAGALVSPEAGKIAVLTKTTRNAMIGFVVLGVALFFASREGTAFTENKANFVWRVFPKFVLGFLFFSTLGSWAAHNPDVFSKAQLVSLANASRWAFLLTFAGVGLRTNIAELGQQGIKPFVVGAIAELGIAAVTLGLVLGADRAFGL